MAELARGVMQKMLFFTILMVFLPIFSYFFSKSVFEGVFGVIPANSYFYSAIVSIVVVHIILACFLYIAFTEDDTPRPQFKKD